MPESLTPAWRKTINNVGDARVDIRDATCRFTRSARNRAASSFGYFEETNCAHAEEAASQKDLKIRVGYSFCGGR